MKLLVPYINNENWSIKYQILNFLINIFLACHFLLKKNLYVEVHRDGGEFVTTIYWNFNFLGVYKTCCLVIIVQVLCIFFFFASSFFYFYFICKCLFTCFILFLFFSCFLFYLLFIFPLSCLLFLFFISFYYFPRVIYFWFRIYYSIIIRY